MKIQLSDNQNCVVLRTKTGLAVLPTNVEQPFQPFYCSNVGEFRRYMSKEESEVLPFAMVALHTPCEVELPEKWRYLWSWKVSDYTEWKPETCCNGGDYAFHEQHNIFGRLNAGKLELLDVVKHTTSAEFDYDEANGCFQNDGMGDAFFLDCAPREDYPSLGARTVFYLYTQIGYGSTEREYSLNQFGSAISVQDALTVQSYEIWPEESKLQECTTPAERLQILQDTFNWEPPKRR